MASKIGVPNIPKPSRVTLVQSAIIVLILVVGVGTLVFGASGTWPSVVAVESDSMSPNLNIGDMVFIIQKDRLGDILTGSEAEAMGVMSFGGYGDIIVYNPNGNTHTTALIHRVVAWVNETEAVETYGFSPEYADAGYITKGDNNDAVDQTFAFSGVGRVYPVQDDWIVGKAVATVPYLGFLPMYIWQIAVFILIILLLYEWRSRVVEKREERKEALAAENKDKEKEK